MLGFADLLPTFVGLGGGAEGVPAGLDGTDFGDLLRGRPYAAPVERTLYWEFHENGFSQALLIDGRWKVIRLGRRDAPMRIYDLEGDPGEAVDLAAGRPDLVARARVLFESERRDSPAWPVRDR